jgi:glutamyl-tRNA synthetase
MEILGSDMVRMRLRRAIEALGGISSKKLKALEKDYARLFSPRT